MASGSNYLTTYYAKRIIGDTAAANKLSALLQTGANIASDTWILNRTNRASTYGIKYLFDTTTTTTPSQVEGEDPIVTDNQHDRIEFYGGQTETISNVITDVPSAWIQLDTGDLYVLGNVGIGHEPDTYKLYVNGTGLFSGFLTVRVNGESGIQICDGKHYNDNTFRAVLDLNPDSGNHGIYSSGYLNGTTFTSDGKWLLVRSNDGSVQMNGNASTATKVYVTNTGLPSSGNVSYYLNFSDNTTSGNQDIRNTAMLYLWRNTTDNYLNVGNASATGAITLWKSGYNYNIIPTVLTGARSATLPNTSGWIAMGGNGSSTGVGGQYAPVYLSAAGVLTEITAGTNAQFYRGDKTWSNTLNGAFTANGTITANGGYLKSTANSNTVTIGSSNTSWCHIENSANIPFWFNKSIGMAQGTTIGFAGNQYRPFQLYLGRNTTSGSNALNANSPLIEFSNSDRSQYCQLIYDDWDSLVPPDSLTLVGNQNGIHFILKNGPLWVQGGSNAGGNVNRLGTTAGMPGNMTYNVSRRGTQIYSNGIAFADPYNGNSNNDAGWIRHIETTANTGYLEIGVGDDGNEEIIVRQYNTSNNVARQMYLLNSAGFTSVSNQSTDSSYAHAAMQIRETNYAGASSDTWGVAPRLAWHWSGRVAAQIGLASNGYLYTAPVTGTTFYKLVYESGSWGISVTGSSGSCTGNAATATRINGNLSAISSATNCNIWVSADASASGSPRYVSGVYVTASTGIITAKGYDGPLVHTAGGVSYIAGAKGTNATVYAKKATGAVWRPAVCLQTSGAGAWQIGNYNDETLEFQYATAANISSQNNSTSEIYMQNGDTGRVMTSGNYTNWCPSKTGSGASGSWGISITGNAATATNVAWTGVTGRPQIRGNTYTVASLTNGSVTYVTAANLGTNITNYTPLAIAKVDVPTWATIIFINAVNSGNVVGIKNTSGSNKTNFTIGVSMLNY